MTPSPRRLALLALLLPLTVAAAEAPTLLGATGYPGHQCSKPSLPAAPTGMGGAAEANMYNAQVRQYNQQITLYTQCINAYLETTTADIQRIQAQADKAVAEANARQ
ncbi:MAG TPA: hypothetical protein VLI06_01065 [Solimonas sp.]|nr:hypothetical protein [Solimonas sp.]